jgi:hypothetical protein
MGVKGTEFFRKSGQLLIIGVATELIYLLSFVRRFPLTQFYRQDTDLGAITQHSTMGFIAFIAPIACLFLLFVLGWLRTPSGDDRGVLRLILGCGGAFGATMSFMYPITAIDVFTYVTESRILLHYHQNPITATPSLYPGDPILALADGWSGSGAPYGPIGIVIDALPSVVARGDLLLTLVGLKLMFSAMVIGAAYCAYLILRRISPRHALAGALLVAWNPLIIFETSGNGHNDITMMLFAVLGLLLVVTDDLVLGSVMMVASILVKYGTALLVPLCVIHCVNRLPARSQRVKYLALFLTASIVICVAAYWPLWQGTQTFSQTLAQNGRLTDSLASILIAYMPASQASLVGRLLIVPAFLYTLWLAAGTGRDLLLACFLATLLLMALAVNNVEPWYYVWPAILAACVPQAPFRIAAISAALGAELYAGMFGFVWVWIGLDSADGFTVVNLASYLATFLPPTTIVALFGYTSLRRQPVSAARDAPWVA